MAYANGYIPRSALSPITRAVNGEQAYHARGAAAFMAMNAESERDYGVTLRVSSACTAYRPYADQLYFWNQYLYHGGNLAARPGTSNHGLRMAVDLATEQMRRIVDKIGHKYGWAKEGPTRRASGGTCATAPASGTATSATRSSRRARPSATRSARSRSCCAPSATSPSA